MVVTWDPEQQADPSVIAVHLQTEGDDEHASAWRYFQSRAYGTAAATAPPSSARAAVPQPEEERIVEKQNARTRLLSLPETFYLVAKADGYLTAPEACGSQKQIWRQFSDANPRFQRQFVVQYHFREQGWLLKSGLNYGAHYVLYRGAASEYHSEYIVYVKGNSQEQLPWAVVQALTRVAADVKKTVLLCDVSVDELQRSGERCSVPSTLTEGDYGFYGQTFHVAAVAIRFMDVAVPDSQQSVGIPYAFQPQPILCKQTNKRKKKKGNNSSNHKR